MSQWFDPQGHKATSQAWGMEESKLPADFRQSLRHT